MIIFKHHLPGGVLLGVSNFFERIKAWAYLTYTVYTLQVENHTAGITYWQFTKKEEPGFLLHLWVGVVIHYKEKTIDLVLVVGDKETKETFNFERLDLKADQHRVDELVEEFKLKISCYLETEHAINPTHPPTEIINIRRISSVPITDMRQVVFSLKNGDKFVALMSDEQFKTVSKKDTFLKIGGRLIYQPFVLLN